MDGLILTPMKQIHHPKGNIFHAMKKSDLGYNGFGEAYFSTINKGDVKGWKKHTKMTLNLLVPFGEIKFVIYNQKTKDFLTVNLSTNNYQRLTIGPGCWLAFQGMSEFNILLNLANIEHDSNEAFNIDINEIKYDW